MVKIIIEYKSMAQVNVAFAQSVGIRVTGMSKYTPIIYAEATPDQVARLQADPNVKKVSLDAPVGMLQEIATPYFEELSTELQTQMTESVDIIKAKDAWAKGYMGKGIKIAIVDSGIWESHPWMQGKVIARWSAYGDDAQDRVSHGTHVAGIASTIAPEAKLINIKVLDDMGSGTFSAIMQGLEKAHDLGADVINMSLGGVFEMCFDGHPLETLIAALSKNIVICAAAGNSGPNSQTIAYPGSSRNVVSVGAVDKSKNVASFSSRGPSYCNEIRPDVAAPGVGIVSSIPPDGTASYSGTSMATPMMSGAMAILRQKAFFSDRQIIEDILKAGGGDNKNNDYGWGVIDISRALDAMSPSPPPQQAGIGPAILAGGFGLGLLYGITKRRKI